MRTLRVWSPWLTAIGVLVVLVVALSRPSSGAEDRLHQFPTQGSRPGEYDHRLWEPVLLPPRIASITPETFVVSWNLYSLFDESTHYQVKIDHLLYGISVKNNEVRVTALKPGATHAVTIVIYHKGEMIGISSPTSVLLGPPRPAAVSVTDITTSTFILHWTSVPTATGYKVQTASGTVLKQAAGDQNTVLVEGLTAGQRLVVVLVAVNPSSDSYPSKAISVQMLPEPPPLAVAVDQIGSTSFFVTWTPVPGAASYTVLKDAVVQGTVGSATTRYQVTGCEPGSSVTVQLRSENETGSSQLSTPTRVLLRPADPAIPYATEIATRALTLNWLPVAGADSYQVFRDLVWQVANVPSPATSARLVSGFNPGDTATFTVVARNATGDSGHSPPLIVTLLGGIPASGTRFLAAGPRFVAPAFQSADDGPLPPLLLRGRDGTPIPTTEILGGKPALLLVLPATVRPNRMVAFGRLLAVLAREPRLAEIGLVVVLADGRWEAVLRRGLGSTRLNAVAPLPSGPEHRDPGLGEPRSGQTRPGQTRVRFYTGETASGTPFRWYGVDASGRVRVVGADEDPQVIRRDLLEILGPKTPGRAEEEDRRLRDRQRFEEMHQRLQMK